MVQATAAVVWEPGGDFVMEDIELEAPRPDEVLVRNVASGICHTDVAVRNQDVKLPLPIILGHEGSGIVEAIGSAISHVKPGDHVVMSGDSCGHCRHCHEGQPTYCDEFVERNLSGARIDGLRFNRPPSSRSNLGHRPPVASAVGMPVRRELSPG